MEEARRKEIQYVRQKEVWKENPRAIAGPTGPNKKHKRDHTEEPEARPQKYWRPDHDKPNLNRLVPCKTEMTKDLRRLADDVAELYSPPRVTAEAPRWGLRPGEAMDLLTGWGFRNPEDRRRAWKYLEQHKPKLVIGSLVCTMLSSLQNMSGWTPSNIERWLEAVDQIEFVA